MYKPKQNQNAVVGENAIILVCNEISEMSSTSP